MAVTVIARLLLAACAWILCAAPAALAQTTPVPPPPSAEAQTGHVTLRLIGPDGPAASGSTVHVALKQEIAPGWHTYWRNSGDAGQSTQLVWTLPPGVKAGEPVWPTPKRLREATLMTYGYQGNVVSPVALSIQRASGSFIKLKARVDLLVCKDVCVPEGADLVIDLSTATAGPGANEIKAALDSAPKPADLTGGAELKNGQLTLAFAGPALKGVDPAGAYFFPYSPRTLDHPSRQDVQRGPDGLTIKVKAGVDSELKGPVDGLLVVGGHSYDVAAKPGGLPAGASGLGEVAAADETAKPASAGGDSGSATGFLTALAFGFLGGLILNLMPCVFPILAMKAAAIARGVGHTPGEAKAHGLAFMAGSVATFVSLAAVLLALRAAGQAAGWGFQLQSPGVTAGLTLLMLAVALNLSGVFEAGLSAQRAAGSVSVGGGLFGAFMTGVLAVLVAAPCTAPYMALATGYALTASPPLALAVFAALGIGLAVPFTLLSFSPALIARLPRPGAWMEGLRHVLAFPMYGTAAWLALVFVQQTSFNGLAFLFGAGVLVAFGLYAFGSAQRLQARSAGGGLQLLVAAAACIGAVFASVQACAPSGELKSEPYSAERLAELRAQGREVFVNFTAAWCVTCKVNEATTLTGAEVKAAVDRTHTVYLVGDWTKRDAIIAKTLAEHGRAGVPLYLVYRPGADQPVVLPQVLTPGIVTAALEGK